MPDPDPDFKPPVLTGGLNADTTTPASDGAEELIKSVTSARGTVGSPIRPPFIVLRELGRELTPPLVHPIAIAIHPEGGIAALDQPAADKFRLTRFPASGAAAAANISAGSGDTALVAPAGITFDANGNAYIPDTGTGHIQKFGPDCAWMAGFAAAGFEGAPFDQPRDVAVDPSGRLYVADTNNSRIVMLLPDGELGWELQQFDGADGQDELYEPQSVCVAGGRVYVADTNNNRVLVFDAQRRLLTCLSEKDFSFPSAVRATGDGTVFVADHGNLRVRRYDPTGRRNSELKLVDKLDGGPVVPGGAQLAIDGDGHVVLVQSIRESVVVLEFTGGGS